MIHPVSERPRRTPQERAALNAHIREVEELLVKRQVSLDSRATELVAQVKCGALSKEEASELFDEWMAKKSIALLQRRNHVAKHFG
jgi:hypothetical protein